MKKNVFSVLVLYNASQLESDIAVERIALLGAKVIICNNSTYDITSKNVSCVKVFNFGENLGIAKAQSIGMEWAFKHGAQFVLQMDQDSEPDEDLLYKLLDCYIKLANEGYKVGLVGSQDFDKDTKEINKAKVDKGTAILEPDFISVSSILSSGSLISKEAYLIVGGMDDDLFIDAVDFEYCWRIINMGYLVVRNNQAQLAHKLGNGKKKILFFINVGVCSPIRHYYQFRNTLLLMGRNYVPMYWKCSSMLKLAFKFFIYPLTLPDGYLRFKYMIKGAVDGVLGKHGAIS